MIAIVTSKSNNDPELPGPSRRAWEGFNRSVLELIVRYLQSQGEMITEEALPLTQNLKLVRPRRDLLLTHDAATGGSANGSATDSAIDSAEQFVNFVDGFYKWVAENGLFTGVPMARSAFTSLSGSDDKFLSVSDMKLSVKEGVFVSAGMIPIRDPPAKVRASLKMVYDEGSYTNAELEDNDIKVRSNFYSSHYSSHYSPYYFYLKVRSDNFSGDLKKFTCSAKLMFDEAKKRMFSDQKVTAENNREVKVGCAVAGFMLSVFERIETGFRYGYGKARGEIRRCRACVLKLPTATPTVMGKGTFVLEDNSDRGFDVEDIVWGSNVAVGDIVEVDCLDYYKRDKHVWRVVKVTPQPSTDFVRTFFGQVLWVDEKRRSGMVRIRRSKTIHFNTAAVTTAVQYTGQYTGQRPFRIWQGDEVMCKVKNSEREPFEVHILRQSGYVVKVPYATSSGLLSHGNGNEIPFLTNDAVQQTFEGVPVVPSIRLGDRFEFYPRGDCKIGRRSGDAIVKSGTIIDIQDHSRSGTGKVSAEGERYPCSFHINTCRIKLSVGKPVEFDFIPDSYYNRRYNSYSNLAVNLREPANRLDSVLERSSCDSDTTCLLYGDDDLGYPVPQPAFSEL